MSPSALFTGAFGPDVTGLHAQLQQRGYVVSPAEVERGFFGPVTRMAVQQFQVDHGLRPTGIADDATLNSLGDMTRAGETGSSSAASAPTSTPTPAGAEVTSRLPTAGGGGKKNGGGGPNGGGGSNGGGTDGGGGTSGGGGTGGVGTNTYAIQGSLVFDYGLPAAGVTLRLYGIGFAGHDAKLAESASDQQGHYLLQTQRIATPNLQIRAVDPKGNEVTISTTNFNPHPQEVLNLVVPASVQTLAPEFQRLDGDLAHVGGITKLGEALENGSRKDLTLLSQATHWDARLLALAATSAKQAPSTGLGQDLLYALFRVGLPTDPQHLAMVPSAAVQEALKKASQAGVVSMNDQQVSAAATAFEGFAARPRLAQAAPGAASSFSDLLKSAVSDVNHQTAFANLYFSQRFAGASLWDQAAALKIPAQTLDALKLQGKFLYLTFNNAPLAQKLQQDLGSLNNLSQLADKDFFDAATWKTTLTALAGGGDGQALQKLVPPAYPGQTAADRLDAYAADLARKVRFSFPTKVVARMIEKKQLLADKPSAGNVTAFLRAAVPMGYELGRTPLNAFLKTAAASVPALDTASKESLKTLHRLYQVTPSHESLQAALNLGFTSAYDIAWYPKDEFMNKYAKAFPSDDEASLVYGKAQQISSVTFNFIAMAKQLDTAPPVYGLSASAEGRQNARNAIVQQFPTMESLFGSMDFCECEHCRSVVSPAAYLVDLLEFLRQSAHNSSGYTPLDVLVGKKDTTVTGRRPDLAALPLSCENTNTAMPYIDLVNEILEYYVANGSLDASAVYDTGSATTDDLIAEPQHVQPKVYNDTLKNARYPRNLPFDLWIETARACFNYFNMPFSEVLDVLRPKDTLELFTDANSYPYYQAQILAESLGLSPAEYKVLTVIDPVMQSPAVQDWYVLYGYADENTALKGQLDPTDASRYVIPPLKSAKNLAHRLGLTYQELTDLVPCGFLNPALAALIFQFERFGISIDDAFRYTGQPGYAPLSAQAKSDFEALLGRISQRYKNFSAQTWLTTVLPANYATKVLVLRDPATGCNFEATTLEYADGTATTPLDFLMLNLFVRLWKKLGWTMNETDCALRLFFPSSLPKWTDANFATVFSSAWKTALVYLAHLNELTAQLNPALGSVGLLPLWAPLATRGKQPLYAQLFLAPSVLNGDPSFDDPSGQFPGMTSDPLLSHEVAVQGALGLSSNDVAAILADAASAVTTVGAVVMGQNVTVPGFSLVNLSICYRYSLLAKCLQLSVADLIALKAMSGLNPFQSLSGQPISVLADDVLSGQTLTFVGQVRALQASGFTVEDLKYLLRHQLDPIGKYQSDPNAVMALMQSLANGLKQIQAENDVPPDVLAAPEDRIEQKLSGMFPAQILKGLFSLLTNSQTFQASQGGVPPGSQIDPAPFAKDKELSLTYDPTTQVQALSYKGALLNWKMAALLQISNSPLLTSLLNSVQQQSQLSLGRSIGDILGVWASLMDYDAVQPAVASGLTSDPLTQKDAAIKLSYDQADQVQWLEYRGVLTDAKKAALSALNPSAILASLLNDVQQLAMPAYRELVGNLLAMWASVQSYMAVQSGVAAGDQLHPSVFAAYPAIELAYDPAALTQKLTYRGVLTDATRVQLAALLPGSTVLANLLQDVRNQAVQLFQTLAANLLTVTTADLDSFSQPFTGIDDSKKQKRLKAELVKVFLPFLAHKLSRQLITQTLASNLASDPSLTGALLTDPGLLRDPDPNNPGQPLLRSFLGMAEPGVSAAYYRSTDGTGFPLATGRAATPDTADPTNPYGDPTKPTIGMPTRSANFEGYLQAPTDGPYRFFAALANANAEVTFQLDSPDPTALFKNPILKHTAAQDGDESSQFVQLKGGVPYHFRLDFNNLGANGASLLLQGENLPKGPMSQIILYPQRAVRAFTKARTLLSKVLQILQVTGLDEREVSYLTANAAQFNGLKLSALPTEAGDDSPARAATLFSQFLTLADYADLRKGPGGGSNGLIDVFQDRNMPWTRLASLTRRDPELVRNVAQQLNALSDFGNNNGIRRIWQALKLVQVVGIPVGPLMASTLLGSLAPPGGSPPPDVLATNLKNAVRARYSPEAWRPIAQSIFDKLRRKKRDALVSYLVNALTLQNPEQLFEYFLVDPGMEPVVQTSRLRLALSSAQTFIQRCLLNLENGNAGHPERNVAPNAIDADWWQWMKRYRVWQANREIFLFPENWMEPELRRDKTDLFQAMESALLQGDVTRDLVEDAFFAYLKGLEVRARLDVVAMYVEQDITHPGLTTVHVVARTYGQPHKYFYRTYSSRSWSSWQKVAPEIESDHITAVVWRGRLNLFWLTFVKKTKPPDPPSGAGDPTATASLGFNDLSGRMFGLKPQTQIQIQLNWSEYFQGKWSDRISTDVSRFQPLNVADGFDPRHDVYIHVSKEVDASGNEGAARIHLDLNGYDEFYAFRVTSKNCEPDFDAKYWEPMPPMPYNTSGIDATVYTGSGLLQARFASHIPADGNGGGPPGGGPPHEPTTDTEGILQTVNNFALLTPANPTAPPFLDPSEPLYQEAGGLVSPFFYKDTGDLQTQSELTFFVQPSLTEVTLEQWEGWAIPTPPPPTNWYNPNWLDKLKVIAQVPIVHLDPPNPGDPVYSVYPVQSIADWATNPATAISYGNAWIGQGGGVIVRKTSADGGGVVRAPGGTGVGAGSSPVLTLVGTQGLRTDQAHAINMTPAAGILNRAMTRG